MFLPPLRVISKYGQLNIDQQMSDRSIYTVDNLEITVTMIIPGCFDITVKNIIVKNIKDIRVMVSNTNNLAIINDANLVITRLMVNSDERILIVECNGTINIKSEPFSDVKPNIDSNNQISSYRVPGVVSTPNTIPAAVPPIVRTTPLRTRDKLADNTSLKNIDDIIEELISGIFGVLD